MTARRAEIRGQSPFPVRSAPWPLSGSPLAAPLALLYQVAVGLRNLAYDRSWLRGVALPIPVVSIGNLSIGGSGKTPLVMETVRSVTK